MEPGIGGGGEGLMKRVICVEKISKSGNVFRIARQGRRLGKQFHRLPSNYECWVSFLNPAYWACYHIKINDL